MYLTKNSKSPFYQIIYEVNGKATSKSTGKKLKADALKYLSNFEKELSKKLILKNITLKIFLNEYEKYIEQTKSKSYYKSIKLSNKFFLEYVGDIDLQKINVYLVDNFIQNTFNRSKFSASLFYRNLKGAFSTAERWNYINTNPFKKIKAPKVPKKNPNFITESELSSILKELKNNTIKNIVIVSYDTGLRLSEVLNLKWSSINIQEKILTVKNDNSFETKSRKDRVIPLTDRAYNMFLSIAPNIFTVNNNSNYIFTKTNSNYKYSGDYVSKYFKRGVKKAKLNDKYSFHTLRHSFASNLVQRGVSLFVVKELLGHSDIKTTMIYSHLKAENLVDAVSKLNKSIG